MADTIITVILSFNILLLVLYFVVRINKRTLDKARDAYKEAVEEEVKRNVTEEESQKIADFISGSSVPEKLKSKAMSMFTHGNVDVKIVEKGNIDKATYELGIIITGKNSAKSINLLPLSFLSSTKKNAFYVRNDERKLIGFFTPFHIILINTETMTCTQTAEDDETAEIEEIPLTSYSREDMAVAHFTAKIYKTFDKPSIFAERFYPIEYKGYI